MANSIIEYFDATVKKFPNKISFIDSNKRLTFKELQNEALCVASWLISNKIHNKPVLIFLDKQVSLVSCFLGVAYSGNFYTPIDTNMPNDRVMSILNSLEPSVVITDYKHRNKVGCFTSTKVIFIDEILNSNDVDIGMVHKVSKIIIDTDPLYVLFTSGSTGVPKGVIISHRAAIDWIDWISKKYKFDENTVIGNQAQLYFDLSIQDVYSPIRNGSTTVLIPNRLYSFPTRVWKILDEENVNTIIWIPSIISMFANLKVLEHVKQLKIKNVLFCGEVMPTKQLNYWIKLYPKTLFTNLYGPTECTEACTYYDVNRSFSDDESLPIGKACENSEALVVDDDNHLITAPNVIGELLIRGCCLSNGYYGDLEKTHASFIQNPLNSAYPELVYKTGDLVYYNENHELMYVCRKDYQIKIHGYRVELGEIEAAVSAISEVDYNCCLFDNEELILIYTGEIGEKQVKEYLQTKLQEYMIPSKFIKIDNMIFNMNGKIDRKALKAKYLSN